MDVLRTAIFFTTLLLSGLANAASVVFLNPGKSDEPFWRSYAQFMEAAARDLDMQLTVLYGERDVQRILSQAREVLQGEQRPDYLVFVNEYYSGPEILRLSRESGVKLFTVNSTLTHDQQQLVGGTRENYPNWIGSLVANDEEAGYLMARSLIEQQRRLQPDGPIELLAFSGFKQTPSAQQREDGLQKALRENPDVRLRQLVYSEWSHERAYQQASLLFARYPDVRLVWSANDEMAFGAMRAAQELGREPGRDLLLSALNNSEEVLRARLDGRISALASGHFTLGGWAMVMLHDYDKGYDFAERGGKDQQADIFILLDKPQAQRLLSLVREPGYRVSFRDFSAANQPQMEAYRFSLEAIFD